ncbi:MAG: glycosyltransferase family 4 protein [Breznakibacter sp.]
MDLVFCLNNSEGGVYSVVKNIIDSIERHYSSTVLLSTENGKLSNQSRIEADKACKTIFRQLDYIKGENFYSIARRFRNLIPQDALIVANDWLELGAVSNLGLQNKVVYVLHGDYDYYYGLAIKHQHAIDHFICVSEHIKNQLLVKLPSRMNDITHLRHPVPDVPCKESYNESEPLRCVFVGRLTPEKGYPLLPVIDERLKERGVLVQWSIVGDCSGIDKSAWSSLDHVHFTGSIPNDRLLTQLRDYDLFLLPSHAEGFPVSLVEAMKAGLVPLVSNLPSGIPELVMDGRTGFRIELDDADGYVEAICHLNDNRNELKRLGENCAQLANDQFNAGCNANAYFKILEKVQNDPPRPKVKQKIYGSRLDQPYIPNFLVKMLRKAIK